MRPIHKNRGSAFILVVGLIVTLAMIGTVFFMITRADTKESLGAAEAAPMRGVAQMQVDKIAGMLVEDLNIGANGPYSDSSDPRTYMDYASPDPDDTDDAYLAATEPAWADGVFVDEGHWPQISNIAGYTDDPGGSGLRVKNVDPAWDYVNVEDNWVDPNNDSLRALIATDNDQVLDAIPYVDTDGDGANDAILYPTGVFDRNGEEYFAAVRVVDLSAFVNVNTAWFQQVPQRDPNFFPAVPLTSMHLSGTGMSGYRDGPINNTLDGVVGALHSARCGDTPQPKDTFTWEAALRAENPSLENDYRLFGWADEMACRWRGDAPGANSRLERTVGTDSNEWRWYSRFLTTASASRDIPRIRPDGSTWSAPLYKVDLNQPCATREEKLDAYHLYRRAFYQVLADISDTGERQRMAAQLAINLVDYRDVDDIPSSAYLPDGAPGERVFGVERQPFLTQAWAKVPHDGNDDPDNDIDAAHMALVLYNPYDGPIAVSDIGGAPWQVAEPASDPPVDLPTGQIQPGEWYVIRSSAQVSVGAGVQAIPPPARIDEVLKRTDDAIRITRPALDLEYTGAGDDYLPVAVAVIDWRTYFSPPASEDSTPGDWRWNLRRDDRAEAHHMAFEAYHVASSTGVPTVPDYSPAGSDTIDGANDLDHTTDLLSRPGASPGQPDALTKADRLLPAPVFVRGHSNERFDPKLPPDSEVGHRLLSVGELGRLLTVGPRRWDRPLDRELTRASIPYALDTTDWLRNDPYAPNFGVGRLDSWRFESLSDPYPDVPVLCLAADFFTTDSPLQDYDHNGDPVDNDGDDRPNPLWADGNTTTVNNRESVVHGRININTATLDALCALPLLEENAPLSPADKALLRLRYAADLIGYRDGLEEIDDPTGTTQYNDYDFAGNSSNPRGLQPPFPPPGGPLRRQLGFAAAGEPAILLRARYLNTDVDSGDEAYVNFYEADNAACSGYLLGAANSPGALNDDGYDRNVLRPGDLSKYERRYTYLANLLTVNSDTYCAYIWVQLGPEVNPVTRRWYIAILDRSNCISPGDRPQVRAFMEVK
ncbi:MAG: hypothetical protein ACOC95_02705 [Planctomycetota bacterium]